MADVAVSTSDKKLHPLLTSCFGGGGGVEDPPSDPEELRRLEWLTTADVVRPPPPTFPFKYWLLFKHVVEFDNGRDGITNSMSFVFLNILKTKTKGIH